LIDETTFARLFIMHCSVISVQQKTLGTNSIDNTTNIRYGILYCTKKKGTCMNVKVSFNVECVERNDVGVRTNVNEWWK